VPIPIRGNKLRSPARCEISRQEEIMKYFSEVDHKVYDSVEELEAAEKKALEAKDARKAESEKVEKA
jgi:hypothetical protein